MYMRPRNKKDLLSPQASTWVSFFTFPYLLSFLYPTSLSLIPHSYTSPSTYHQHCLGSFIYSVILWFLACAFLAWEVFGFAFFFPVMYVYACLGLLCYTVGQKYQNMNVRQEFVCKYSSSKRGIWIVSSTTSPEFPMDSISLFGNKLFSDSIMSLLPYCCFLGSLSNKQMLVSGSASVGSQVRKYVLKVYCEQKAA